MKRSISIILVLLTLSILLCSCGVMFGGSKYRATIIAKDHPNAEIYVNGKNLGKGQVVTLQPRNRNLIVELKQEGCEPVNQTFKNRFRTGSFILSIIWWGPIGLGIDLGAGASYKPDHINNPAIKKVSDKNYTFSVDYPACKI